MTDHAQRLRTVLMERYPLLASARVAQFGEQRPTFRSQPKGPTSEFYRECAIRRMTPEDRDVAVWVGLIPG